MILPEEKDITNSIEKYVLTGSMNYIDAVLAVCEDKRIDPEVMGKFLSKPIKEKLEMEARDLNLLKNKKPKLPF
tara:strand:- start:546 stop:767 length:222 start_codon:yes stop_codon:yes gene_type:complete